LSNESQLPRAKKRVNENNVIVVLLMIIFLVLLEIKTIGQRMHQRKIPEAETKLLLARPY